MLTPAPVTILSQTQSPHRHHEADRDDRDDLSASSYQARALCFILLMCSPCEHDRRVIGDLRRRAYSVKRPIQDSSALSIHLPQKRSATG